MLDERLAFNCRSEIYDLDEWQLTSVNPPGCGTAVANRPPGIMALMDKYRSLLDIANQSGVSNLQIKEENNVLHVSGTVPNKQVKRRLWEEYNRISPGMRSGDLILHINVDWGEEERTAG